MIKRSLRKISLLLILVSILYFCYDFYKQIDIKNKQNQEINLFFKQYNNNGNQITKENSDYLMILEIPKINLKQGIHNFKHKNNNIDVSVTILNESVLLTEDNSVLFLAAHSGNSNYSYFKNLNKLELNDEVIIYYNEKNYTYHINSIYTMSKEKDFFIKNNSKSKLFLITCLDDYKYLILEGI